MSQCDAADERRGSLMRAAPLILALAAVLLLCAQPLAAITVISTASNAEVHLGFTFAQVEFENPLSGTETILGYPIIEWRDADYAPGWYDDWSVNNPGIDGSTHEIWMRSNGHSIWTTLQTPTPLVSIHLNGDENDGLAQVMVDGVEVARLDMYSSPSERAVVLVRNLTIAAHTVTVNDLGASPSGAGGDDVATLGAAALQPPEVIKWEQPPEMIGPDQFYGWDELSIYGGPQIAADDWVCTTGVPVAKIRWWGSFIGWQDPIPPPRLPFRFHFAIWTDVPMMPPMMFSHPGVVLWEHFCENYSMEFVGYDVDPRQPGILEACFLFECELPEDAWFRQDPGQHIYWLSIAADYLRCNADFDHDGDVDAVDLNFFIQCMNMPQPGCEQADLNGDGAINLMDLTIMQCQLAAGWPDPACCPGIQPPPPFPWGWKTRPHRDNNPDDAVRIFEPLTPRPGMMFVAGDPLWFPDPTQSWDASFVLIGVPQPPPQGACCIGWTCIVTTAVDCAQRGGRYQGDGTNCGPPNPCEIRDVVICEPGAPQNPTHPPIYWYDVTPAPGFGRCDFHVKVLDPSPANYTAVVAPPTWLFSVHQVGSDWWASWWDPDCDNPIFGTFRFQFTNPSPIALSDWTTTISSTDDPNAQWIDRSQNHVGEPDGLGYRVHVPMTVAVTEACCLPGGACIDVDPIDCILLHGGIPQGPGTNCLATPVICDFAKWSQLPTASPAAPPRMFYGWNELSIYGSHQIAGDDWLCADERKIRDIHWWGSYINWQGEVPPPDAPIAFHIGIWTDVPASPGSDPPWSHPGEMIWEFVAPLPELRERAVAMDFHPNWGFETCFQYDLRLPPGVFFQQRPGVNAIHWITIAAMYPHPVPPIPSHPWGWKTRLPHWNDDAIRIFDPTAPLIPMQYAAGEPIETPEGSWDLAFVLTSNRRPCPSARGDANCDGAVDFFDIDPFLLALFNPAGYAATYCGGDFCTVDVNCDESVDFFDIDPFIVCLFSGCAPCP